MDRVVLAVGGVIVAAVVAWVVQRRRPAPPTQGRWPVPTQLDRADFARPDAPWLVAVFTSATCESCAKSVAQAEVLASTEVAVQEVEVGARGDLHRRYAIEAVPVTVVADADGVVRATFVGSPTATDLWAAVAECRDAPAP
jgi:hypothetical protein